MNTRTHQTAQTQFVEANGIRFAYRRFGKPNGVPLVFNQHYTGTMDHWDPAVTDGFAKDRGANEADGVVGEIRKAGGRADAVAADLERADGPHKLAKLARDIVGDRLDILVANAGVSKSATIEDTTIEDFDRLFAVNVRAPLLSRPATASDPVERKQYRSRRVARGTRRYRDDPSLCSNEGRY